MTRTGIEAYLRNAESLYFQGFQRILPHRCPNVFYTNFINLDRGGFKALPTSTALYFKGIHDYAPTMPQANFSFILYIFFSILRVKSSPYPVRDSKPITKVPNPFKIKDSSAFCPNAVQKKLTGIIFF